MGLLWADGGLWGTCLWMCTGGPLALMHPACRAQSRGRCPVRVCHHLCQAVPAKRLCGCQHELVGPCADRPGAAGSASWTPPKQYQGCRVCQLNAAPMNLRAAGSASWTPPKES